MNDNEFIAFCFSHLSERPFVLLFEGENGLDHTVSNLPEYEIAPAYEQAAADLRAGRVRPHRAGVAQ